jgi:flagellar hook-length control protein FliK
MSGKVSTAAPASSGASSTGGRSVPAAAASGAAGSSGPDGVGSGPGARGAAAGSTAHFSSAMAEAAHAGEPATPADLRDGAGHAGAEGAADGARGSNTGIGAAAQSTTTADVTGDASPAGTPGAPEIGMTAVPVLTQSAPGLKTCANGAGKAGGRVAVSTGASNKGGSINTSTTPTDPVALAMLLAASGVQLGDAGASTASSGTSGAPANASDGSDATMALGSAVGKLSTGMPGANAVPAADLMPVADTTGSASSANAVPAGAAVNTSVAAASAPDVASSAANPGVVIPDQAAGLQAKSANPPLQSAPSSIVTDAAGLPELVRTLASGAAQTPAAEATISVPLSSGGWPQAVAAQVHWFVNNDVQSATLRLSPEHLGPVEVHLDVRDSQVNVSFNAAHAETRAALEQTVPRLREIFASGGLSLGQANVQQDPRPGSQSGVNPLRAALAHAQTVEPVAVAAGQALGLVDEYA